MNHPRAFLRRRWLTALGLTLVFFGCDRGRQPAGDGRAADSVQAQLPPIDVTPEDSAIFNATMEWAKAERLDTFPIGQIVARVGRRFVGKPYVPKTLDPPGPERLIVNLRTFDCVTFVESSLALARIIKNGDDEFGDFVDQLRTVRYRDGIGASYADRLHYFSEWIAVNTEKGIVRDITREIGGVPDSTHIDFMSTHADLYRQLEDSATVRQIREQEAILSAKPRYYIPEDSIAVVAGKIQDGDIIAATSTVPGLDIAHTGLALWVEGKLHLMHAPLIGTVVEISKLPLGDRIQGIEGQDGIMVARPL
jgi:hypothetical protein